MILKKTAIITLLSILVGFDCGTPLGPDAFLWQKVAELPKEYRGAKIRCAGPHGVYIISSYADRDVVVSFNGQDFSIEYDVGQNRSDIIDIGFIGGIGYLSVTDVINSNSLQARLLQWRGNEWETIITRPDFIAFKHIRPIDDDSCWLAVEKTIFNYNLAKYDNGNIIIYDQLGPIKDLAYAHDQNMVYAQSTLDPWTILVSSDGGATWAIERIDPPVPYNLPKAPESIAASPDALYVTAYLAFDDIEYRSIIKRTGPAGSGIYELSYAGYLSDVTREIGNCVFRDRDHGLAVGFGTSIYTNDSKNWIRENTYTYYNFEEYNLIPDPRGGFWCSNRSSGTITLLWHP